MTMENNQYLRLVITPSPTSSSRIVALREYKGPILPIGARFHIYSATLKDFSSSCLVCGCSVYDTYDSPKVMIDLKLELGVGPFTEETKQGWKNQLEPLGWKFDCPKEEAYFVDTNIVKFKV